MTEARQRFQMDGCELYTGDAVEVVSELPERSVQCVVTSPPYWSLRDYSVEGQTGLEDTPEEHVEHLVEIFRAVRRVLRDDGTVWLNYGDAYAGAGHGPDRKAQDGWDGDSKLTTGLPGYKAKDLLGLPWQVAFALREDGWYLRSAIVWAKGLSFCDLYSGSVMPESVNGWRYEKQEDGTLKLRKGSWRPTTAYEHVFLLAKTDSYFCDAEAVREGAEYPNDKRKPYAPGQIDHRGNGHERGGGQKDYIKTSGRNPRNVWAIGTSGTDRRHYAAFPEALVEPCVQAGTPEHACGVCGAPWAPVVETSYDVYRSSNIQDQPKQKGRDDPWGFTEGAVATKQNSVTAYAPTCEHKDKSGRPVVLDPFSGTGTTLVCAIKQGCSGIGIDISQEYNDMAAARLRSVITGVPEDCPEQEALFSEREADNE